MVAPALHHDSDAPIEELVAGVVAEIVCHPDHSHLVFFFVVIHARGFRRGARALARMPSS